MRYAFSPAGRIFENVYQPHTNESNSMKLYILGPAFTDILDHFEAEAPRLGFGFLLGEVNDDNRSVMAFAALTEAATGDPAHPFDVRPEDYDEVDKLALENRLSVIGIAYNVPGKLAIADTITTALSRADDSCLIIPREGEVLTYGVPRSFRRINDEYLEEDVLTLDYTAEGSWTSRSME